MKTWRTKSGYSITRLLAGRSNVFLLSNGNKNILVDTSVAVLWNRLQRRIERTGNDHIDYLVLTHAHFDHAANAARIREKYNALVVVHKNEAAYLSTGDNILPNGTTFITRPIAKIAGRKLFRMFRYRPCPCDISVDSILDLKDFGFNAYILHTPGHTRGSVCIIVDDEVALAGDAMFGIFRWSVFPPYAEDPEMMVRSWGKLLKTNCKLFMPSHGSANSRALLQKDYDKRK